MLYIGAGSVVALLPFKNHPNWKAKNITTPTDNNDEIIKTPEDWSKDLYEYQKELKREI